MKLNSRNRVRNHGVSLMYTLVIMVAMLAVCSLAVDVARVQVAKTELRRAVDSAARFGAMGLDMDGATAINNAMLSAADNTVDGKTFNLVAAQDIVIGKWNSSARTFTAVP